MPSPQVNQDELLIKLGMKRKKKWTLEGQTKRTNWKSVSDRLPSVSTSKVLHIPIYSQTANGIG